MPEANNWNDKTITEFRANGGRVGGNFEGAPVALVHHRGRKSGREYVNPVTYLPDDTDNDAIYVFATKGGAPSNPDWYYNLAAAGQGTVERGTETYPVTVRELQGDERDRIYDEQARRYPGFADYAKRTAGIRTIPVLELNRSLRRSLNTPDEESEMTYDNEAIVRHAYHTAEGSVLDVAGFVGSFANDGVINLGYAGIEPSGVGQESYRGEQLGELVLRIAKLFPDVHRELHRVNVLGDMVAVELSIQGTFLGPLETPAGIVQPTGAKVDGPCADFWYLRDGKIEMFDCYIMLDTMRAQMGVT
jgi:deazaflavin-dependent oxidoreductase (nitroreductase family)